MFPSFGVQVHSSSEEECHIPLHAMACIFQFVPYIFRVTHMCSALTRSFHAPALSAHGSRCELLQVRLEVSDPRSGDTQRLEDRILERPLTSRNPVTAIAQA